MDSFDVEAIGWLIEDEKFWLVNERQEQAKLFSSFLLKNPA
jgi:hypothetical protein